MQFASGGVQFVDGSAHFVSAGLQFVDDGVQFANAGLKYAIFGSTCTYNFSSICTLAMILCFLMTCATRNRKAKPDSSSIVGKSNRNESPKLHRLRFTKESETSEARDTETAVYTYEGV